MVAEAATQDEITTLLLDRADRAATVSRDNSDSKFDAERQLRVMADRPTSAAAGLLSMFDLSLS